MFRVLGHRLHGDAEVDQLHVPAARDHHVAGCDVPVDEVQLLALDAARGVERFEAGEHVDRDSDRDPERHAFESVEEQRHRDPVDVLHREVVPSFDLTEVGHVREVRVVDERGHARFFEEQIDVRLGPVQVRQESLDDEPLLKAFGAATFDEEDLGHSPDAELPNELEITEWDALVHA